VDGIAGSDCAVIDTTPYTKCGCDFLHCGGAIAERGLAMQGAMMAGGGGRKSGTFLGFPLEGFGFLLSFLLALASGFFAFFLTTAVAIFSLLVWNQGMHHTVNYADSYLYAGLPAAVVVWVVAFFVFGSLWIRAKITAK
jgi:hypothetical protein